MCFRRRRRLQLRLGQDNQSSHGRVGVAQAGAAPGPQRAARMKQFDEHAQRKQLEKNLPLASNVSTWPQSSGADTATKQHVARTILMRRGRSSK